MGRNKVGETHHATKVTDDVAREIHRRFHEKGQDVPTIAKDFEAQGISKENIYHIVNERNWQRVTNPSIDNEVRAAFELELRRNAWSPVSPVPEGLVPGFKCHDLKCDDPSHATFTIDPKIQLHIEHSHSEQLPQRFWSNVDRGSEDDCWLWKASKNKGGYGTVGVDGATRLAHRVAWELSNCKPIPKGKLALHHCDVPACVNPRHIYPSTHKDNADDTTERGRRNPRKGEANPASTLANWEVLEIVQRFNSGESAPSIAQDFGINRSVVNQIVKGKTWVHLTGIDSNEPRDFRRRAYRTDFTDEQVVDIRGRLQGGEDAADLALEFNKSDRSIRNLGKGRTFPNLPGAGELPSKILRGEQVNTSKLNPQKVVSICEEFQLGASLTSLARKYGVTKQTVSAIVRGETWKHVGGPIAPSRGSRKAWKGVPGEAVKPTKIKRGPTVKGSAHPSAKLTEAEALEIYKLAHSGELSDRAIAERYGIATSQVSSIRQGITWSAVTGHKHTPSGPLAGERHPNSKLSDDEVKEIYRMAHEGELSQAQIARDFGVSPMTVTNIKLGKSWASVTGHGRIS